MEEKEAMIRTPNGMMQVYLDRFFPSEQAKVRKLFRLMAAGMEAEQLQEVKAYQENMQDQAGARRTDAKETLKAAEEDIRELDEQIAKLKAARDGKKEAVKGAKKEMRRVDAQLKGFPGWIRDFEALCGDACHG